MKRIDLTKVNVARSNTIRDINSRIVLNYIREKGPISRADIARETDLQRSTVSLIINDLKRTSLIEEVFGESSGGRPPSLLTLPTSQPVAVGIDLGTLKTVVATCDLTGRIIERDEFWTDPNVSKTASMIIDCVKGLTHGATDSIGGIGISIPALVDAKKGHVLYSPHFKWRDPDLIETIADKTGFAVMAENDANAAALAELWFGRSAIRDVRDFILVFIENGIGTGIVFDGQIYRGKGGVAGEFGHMRIGTNAPVACANESRECWEAFASERAALARYAALLGNQNFADRINFIHLVELAFNGDKNAVAALKETAHYIGLGMGNLIQGLSPEAIVVSGSIARAWPIIGEDIKNATERVICRGMTKPLIIPSTLGAEYALMGAFSLVLADKFASISI